MALRFNGLSPTGPNPFSAMCTTPMGNTFGAVGKTSNLTTRSALGSRHAIKQTFSEYASNPPASESPVAWTMADKGGDLAAELVQSNTEVNNIQLGIAMESSMTQDASVTAAALSMITSMSANLQQEGQLTGPMQMTMNIAANLVQEGQIDAALGLIAWMQASLTQDADVSTSNLRGTMSMDASIVSYSAFTAEGVRDAVWNALLANYPGLGTAGKALASAGSGGVDLEALAQAILAAAQVTPIHSNVKKMNSADVIGSGIEADKWRGV